MIEGKITDDGKVKLKCDGAWDDILAQIAVMVFYLTKLVVKHTRLDRETAKLLMVSFVMADSLDELGKWRKDNENKS
jgi:hypothetical protein